MNPNLSLRDVLKELSLLGTSQQVLSSAVSSGNTVLQKAGVGPSISVLGEPARAAKCRSGSML